MVFDIPWHGGMVDLQGDPNSGENKEKSKEAKLLPLYFKG